MPCTVFNKTVEHQKKAVRISCKSRALAERVLLGQFVVEVEGDPVTFSGWSIMLWIYLVLNCSIQSNISCVFYVASEGS